MPSFHHTAGLFADTGLDGEEIGTLVMVVDRAKNLPNRRTMGKQDPYCAARLGKEAKRTDTDRRGGQTPRWDQELRFTVHDSVDFHSLKISIFNDDRKSDLIGEAIISLDNVLLPGGGTKDGWHNLSCKGRYAGEIRLEFTFYDTRPQQEKQPERESSEHLNSTAAAAMSGPRAQPPVKRRPLPTSPASASMQHQTADYSQHQADSINHREPQSFEGLASHQHLHQEYDDEHLPEVYHEPARPLPTSPHRTHDGVPHSGASSAPLRATRSSHFDAAPLQQESYLGDDFEYSDDPYALQQAPASDEYAMNGDYDERDQQGYQEATLYNHPAMLQPGPHRRHEEQPPPLMHSHSEPEVYRPEQSFGRGVPQQQSQYHYATPERQQGAYSYPPPAPQQYQRPLPEPAAARYTQEDDHYAGPAQQQRPAPYINGQSHSAPIVPQAEHNYSHSYSQPPRQHPQYRQPANQQSMYRQPKRPLHQPVSAEDMPVIQPRERDAPPNQAYDPQRQRANSQEALFNAAGEPFMPRAVDRLRASEGSSSNHAPSRSEPPSQAKNFGRLGQRRSYGGIPLHTTYVAGQDESPSSSSSRINPSSSQSRDPPARGYNPDLPLLKPRAISPTRENPPETPPQQQPLRPGRKSLSPAVKPDPNQPKPFSTPFSPDSYDQLNPHAPRSNSSTVQYGQPSREPSPMYGPASSNSAPTTPANSGLATTADGRIIRSDGKAVDPTDHLPGHTWAPEPETKSKKPTVTVNVRRFGPRDAPSSAPPTTSPNSSLPSNRDYSTTNDYSPRDSASKSRSAPRINTNPKSRPLAPTLPTALNAATTSPYPPPVPGKIPISPVRSSVDDYEPGGNMAALHKEISGIDIGPRRGLFGRRKVWDADY